MNSKKRIFKSLSIALIATLAFTACVKKRKDYSSPLSGLRTGETLEIDKLNNKWFSFEALSFQEDGENFSAEEVEIAEDVDFVNNLPYVNYKSDSSLLGEDLRLKARVGAKYQILQKLDGSFLKIYLVGAKKDIPFESWTYSEELEDGRYAMPLVGYPVNYIRTVNSENSQGKKTSFVSEDVLSKPEDFHLATHIAPSWSSRTPYSAPGKKDLLPVTMLFNEENKSEKWMFSGYYEIASYNSGRSWTTGGVTQNTARPTYGVIPEVELVKRSNGIYLKSNFRHKHSFVEKASEDYKELDELFMGKLPVTEYSSFREVSNKAGKALKEEATNTNLSNFMKAEYFKPDFKEFSAGIRANPKSILKKLIVSKDMLSWIIKTDNYEVRFNLETKKSTLKRWGQNFVPRNTFQSDKQFFTLINPAREKTLDSAIDAKYIANKDIDGRVARFAHGAKIEIRPTGALAKEEWVDEVLKRATFAFNKLYKKAYEGYTKDAEGRPVEPPQFSYNAEPVHFGDPRYLKVNFSGLLFSGAGGWSAPFSNPKTGQIVGGSNYVVAAADLGNQERFVLAYVEGLLGKGTGVTLLNPKVRGDFMEQPRTDNSSSLSSQEDVLSLASTEIGLVSPKLNYALKNFNNPNLNFTTDSNGQLYLQKPSFQNSYVGLLPSQVRTDGLNGAITLKHSPQDLSLYDSRSLEEIENTPFDDLYLQRQRVLEKREAEYQRDHINFYITEAGGTALLDDNSHFQDNHFKISSPEVDKLITNLCDDLFDKVEGLRKTRDNTTKYIESVLNYYDQLKPEIKSCAKKLAIERISSTVTHEMLHGSGLSHNMHGSSDEDNYLSEEFIKEVYGLNIEDIPGEVFWKTSSIMDYGSRRTVETYLPGPYDLAAIMFIQTGRFENQKGGTTSVITGVGETEDGIKEFTAVNINQAQYNSQKEKKVYEVCSDRDIQAGRSVLNGGFRLNEDPMCDFSDQGATPLEKAQDIIKGIEYYKAVAAISRDSDALSQGFFDWYVNREIGRLKEIYLYWRVLINRAMGTKERGYLEEFENPEEYANFIATSSKSGSPYQQKIFKEYYQARNLIFNFLLDESFSPNHYCVMKYLPIDRESEKSLLPQGTPPLTELIEFSKVKEIIQRGVHDYDDLHVGSCSNQISQQVLANYLSDKKGHLVEDPNTQILAIVGIGEVGHPLKGFRYSHNVLRANSRQDAVGLATYRALAFRTLTQRFPTSFEDRSSGFYPNMVDEPDLRMLLGAKVEDRLNNGVRLKGFQPLTLVQTAQKRKDQELITSLDQSINAKLEKITGVLNLANYQSIDDAIQSRDPMFISTVLEASRKQAKEACYADSNSFLLFGGNSNPAFEKFAAEDDLIGFFMTLYRYAINIPNDIDTSIKRSKRFRVDAASTYQREFYTRNRPNMKFIDMGSFFIHPREGASFAKQAIAKVDEINLIQSAERIRVKNVKDFIAENAQVLSTVVNKENNNIKFFHDYMGLTFKELRGKYDAFFEVVNEAVRRNNTPEDERTEGSVLNDSEATMIQSIFTPAIEGFEQISIVEIENPDGDKIKINYFEAPAAINEFKSLLSRVGELNKFATDDMKEQHKFFVTALKDIESAYEKYSKMTLREALFLESDAAEKRLLEINESNKCALHPGLRGQPERIKEVTGIMKTASSKFTTSAQLDEIITQRAFEHNLTLLESDLTMEEKDAHKNLIRNSVMSFLRLQ